MADRPKGLRCETCVFYDHVEKAHTPGTGRCRVGPVEIITHGESFCGDHAGDWAWFRGLPVVTPPKPKPKPEPKPKPKPKPKPSNERHLPTR